MQNRLLALALYGVLFSSWLVGQTPTPVPDPNVGVHFVTDTAFYQLSGGKQATVFTARIPVSVRYSGVLSQWLVPTAKGNVSLGGVEFRETLVHLIKSPNANPELQKLEVFGRGQIGTEMNSLDNSRNFAFAFEGGVEFPVGTVAGGTIKTGVRFGFLGVPGAKEHFELGSQATISPQISVSF